MAAKMQTEALAGGGSVRRVLAVVLRHLFILRTSWPRLFELFYWPTMQMILWGFISTFLTQRSDWLSQAAGVLIAGVLLWEVLFRSQFGISIGFLEEMWSRNLGHLFVSPLRPVEWVAGLMLLSFLRTLVALSPAALLALVLYGFNIFSLGPALVAFIFGLMMMGWWLALLINAMILRFGMGAESLAWMATFVLAPVSCIYYPIAALPAWLAPLAHALPSANVFEGMRAAMFDGVFRADLLGVALLENLVFMGLALLAFSRAFRHARNAGTLLQLGE